MSIFLELNLPNSGKCQGNKFLLFESIVNFLTKIEMNNSNTTDSFGSNFSINLKVGS